MVRPLNILCVEKHVTQMPNREAIQVLPMPAANYDTLKTDFHHAPHLAAVDKLRLKGADGVIVRSKYIQDGLLAAVYIFRKCERDDVLDLPPLKYAVEQDDDEDEDGATDDPRLGPVIYNEDGLVNVPVLTSMEFSAGFASDTPRFGGAGMFGAMLGQDTSTRTPYWVTEKYPLIIVGHHFVPPVEQIKQSGRFVVYLLLDCDESSGSNRLTRDPYELNALFELEGEVCQLAEPGDAYYQHVLREAARKKGYKLGRNVDLAQIIIDLKTFRGRSFNSALDICTLVKKAIRRKNDKTLILRNEDFERAIAAKREAVSKDKEVSTLTAAQELDALIGLKDVKSQLERIVKRMKFEQQRKTKGLITNGSHMAAVFMGNPGTAKTTVARIFGQMLCEAGVIENREFHEVTRKDLVGKFVGWTAPTVAAVFEKAKGGTIFIDEAYSLMSEGQSDGFSGEALAEIVTQMENNPDTLVIFAGYPDKMRKFIHNVNPGLRSRLTNIIEFPDYDAPEMAEIFVHLLTKEGYQVEDRAKINVLVAQLIQSVGTGSTGNGRLMRKLFRAALGYTALWESSDYVTIRVDDVARAVEEIKGAETMLATTKPRSIGFGA